VIDLLGLGTGLGEPASEKKSGFSQLKSGGKTYKSNT